MSDPSPSGETWVCRAAKGYTRCDILPCTVRGYPEHKRCGPVPSSDTPSEPFRVAAARWSRVSLMASSLIHAAAADRGEG